jgi:hypothetical protein
LGFGLGLYALRINMSGKHDFRDLVFFIAQIVFELFFQRSHFGLRIFLLLSGLKQLILEIYKLKPILYAYFLFFVLAVFLVELVIHISPYC